MIETVHIDQISKWENLVDSFFDSDIYYCSTYLKAFQSHGDGEPILFYYEEDNIRAINVAMKRKVSETPKLQLIKEASGFFDIASPYGYAGFLIEGTITDEKLDKLESEYRKWCINQKIVCEFVRCNPISDNYRYINKIYDIKYIGPTITLDIKDRNKIWNNLSGKNRNTIRKALKSNITIHWGLSKELIDVFIPMYKETMDLDNAANYYYFNRDFYNSILEDNKYKTLIFYAMYENTIISMAMILFHNNRMHYHLSAKNREYQNLGSMNLLLYEAACWGSINGYTLFHLGGGVGCKEDGLYKFKKSFSKESESSYYVGKKIFNEQKYIELNEKSGSKSDCNENFFPIYRK